MKQLKVSLPDDLRTRLEAVSTATGRSLGEEIRDRLEESFAWQEFGATTREFLLRAGHLTYLIPPQVGGRWNENAAAFEVFREAIALLLARARPPGEPVPPTELPANRPVQVTDLRAMAAALEAIVSLTRPPQNIGQIDRQFGTQPVLLEASRKKEEDKS
jgi:hypothetical protein